MSLPEEVHNVAQTMSTRFPPKGSYYHSSYPQGVHVIESAPPHIVSFRLEEMNAVYTVTSKGGTFFITVRFDGSSIRSTFL